MMTPMPAMTVSESLCCGFIGGAPNSQAFGRKSLGPAPAAGLSRSPLLIGVAAG
jgi:hypothetical protein